MTVSRAVRACGACPWCLALLQITSQVKELQEQIKRMESRVQALSGNSPQVNAAEEAAKR